jgi:hypothetical protein
VAADALPDDMRLTCKDRLTVAEQRSSVRCPGHLELTRSSPVGFDAQSLAKGSGSEVVHEPAHRSAELATLGWSQGTIITQKAGRSFVGWHYLDGSSSFVSDAMNSSSV